MHPDPCSATSACLLLTLAAPLSSQDLGLRSWLLAADEKPTLESSARETPAPLRWMRPEWPQEPHRKEPFGAEDPRTEGRRPAIPEPMVFDLVRPLGARSGELEVNTLGLGPLRREQRRGRGDPLGSTPESRNPRKLEWAPEIEFAPWDNFALEFELPIEGTTLEAYKVAAQLTLATDPAARRAQGIQGILQYDRDPGTWTGTLLYVAGERFLDNWSVLGMIGGRAEFGGSTGDPKAEFLLNLSLFRDISHSMSIGLETNTSLGSPGQRTFLAMPQLHWELTNRCMLQFGAGVRIDEESYLPLAGFRLIWTF